MPKKAQTRETTLIAILVLLLSILANAQEELKNPNHSKLWGIKLHRELISQQAAGNYTQTGLNREYSGKLKVAGFSRYPWP